MKKILLISLSILALAAIFTACEEKEELFYPGVAIYTSDMSFYPLDAGVTGSIEVSNTSVKSVKAFLDGEEIATISLSNGVGTYDFPKGLLGIGEIKDVANVTFTAETSNGPASVNKKFEVKNPLIIDGPADFYPAEDTTIYIKFKIAEDCTPPTSLVITKQLNSEVPVELTDEFNMLDDSIAVDLTNEMLNDTLTFVWNFSNDNGDLEAEHVLLIIVKRAWDFEEYEAWSTEFAPWVVEDIDALPLYSVGAFDYPGEGQPAAWRIFDFEEAGEPAGWEANSGTKYAFAMAAMPDGANGNNDWMTSDNFDIEDGYELSLFAKSITDYYGLERLVVIVVDNADESETILTPDPYEEVPTDWTNYTWDLSDWAGKNVKVKIGCVSHDAFALFIDDFEIVTPEGKSIVNYNFETPSSGVTHTKVRK